MDDYNFPDGSRVTRSYWNPALWLAFHPNGEPLIGSGGRRYFMTRFLAALALNAWGEGPASIPSPPKKEVTHPCQ